MLALQMEEGIVLQKVIRAPRAKYPTDVYLVPKDDGRLVIGATNEEMEFDTRLTAGGLFELLRGTWEAVPGIYDLPVLETWTGLRPGSRDNAPILGETNVENLIMATGHYRNGILLTPVTAREIASLILRGEDSETIAPFQLSRFVIITEGTHEHQSKRRNQRSFTGINPPSTASRSGNRPLPTGNCRQQSTKK